jgi:hypothetical protein
MAWGLEARVPFLDKSFLEVAMNIDAKYKMFSKGTHQQVDEDGRPKMEKVGARCGAVPRRSVNRADLVSVHSAKSVRLLA